MSVIKYGAFIFGLLLVLVSFSLNAKRLPIPTDLMLLKLTSADSIETVYYMVADDGTYIQHITTLSFEYFLDYEFSPDNQWLYIEGRAQGKADKDVFRINWLTGYYVNLTFDDSDHNSLRGFTPDGNKIIIGSNANNRYRTHLSLYSLDGRSKEEWLEIYPSSSLFWSNDHTTLFYSQSMPNQSAAGFYRLDMTTDETELLISEPNYAITAWQWLPDGKTLLLHGTIYGEDYAIFKWYALNTEDLTIKPLLEWDDSYILRGFAEDGEWLLFQHASEQSLHCLKIDNSEFHPLMEDAGSSILQERPSFILRDVAFLDQNRTLYKTTCSAQATPQPIYSITYPSSIHLNAIYPWQSPQGTWIIFTEYDESDWEFYRIAPDGSQYLQLTNDSYRNYIQTITTDEKWLYYTAETTSQAGNLYRVQLDGTHTQQLTYFQNKTVKFLRWFEFADKPLPTGRWQLVGSLLSLISLLSLYLLPRH